MRIAFFSPLPPARSGIADYSEALLGELHKLADVDVFSKRPERFDAGRYDIALYQIGNNAWHDFCYEMALEHPGVVVLHEANLHHLVADLTIKRGDWDAYMREIAFSGGTQALAYARQNVITRQKGPDYEGVPMLRRILERSRGIIVHSSCVADAARENGFAGPVARIPHGAWLPEGDRFGYRQRLGIIDDSPLVGIFGFLKPYKRITESLRAFRKLVRVSPKAKMILVGEPHPELRLQETIRSLGLSASVRPLGFTPIEDFTGYMAACDVVLNLRYPTVGENSGTLMRALGLGKPVLVSDVGSFREFPDEICLKVPVDTSEEETIFEYLNLLVSRQDLAHDLGQRAREWVARECNWTKTAQRYASFLAAVAAGEGEQWRDADALPEQPVMQPEIPPDYILGWASQQGEGESYARTHLARLKKTLEITPAGGPEDRVLEMGAYLQITPALKEKLGYGEVRGCYYGKLGQTQRREVESENGEWFSCEVDLFDAEKDRFPYEDGSFSTVLCCELLEHLPSDPMHMMSEINRILKTGGHVVLTTPNIASLRAVGAILLGYHPGFYASYLMPAQAETDARHNREYAPREIAMLLESAGFEVELLTTGPFLDEAENRFGWVQNLLERVELPADLRGEDIYAVGKKQGPVQARYPGWLYSGGA
ncbi:MAG TPA: glycosyltransferase [Bryobacteraceae bacterium]|nr:glycosyltransferase [Bryobacteraceae bacterium]